MVHDGADGDTCLQRSRPRAAGPPIAELTVGIWVRIASMSLSPGGLRRRPPTLLTAKHYLKHQIHLV